MRRTLLVAGLSCLAALRPSAQALGDDPVHVVLKIAGGRASFNSGEPIRLEMRVTADRPGYVIDVDGPDHAIDEMTVSPASGTQSVAGLGWSDVSVIEKLTATPVVVPLTLNYWVRFDRTGDYTVQVVTRRVFPKDPHDWTPARGRPPLSVRSEPVKFHVDVLDEMQEQNLVGPALAHIDASASAESMEQVHAAEELAFLPGDAAALAKYRAYRWLETRAPSNARNVIERGFAMSRRPSLILEQFERELTDVSLPVSAQAINLATRLRVCVEHPDLAGRDSGPLPVENTEPWSSVKRRYVDAAIDSLAARTGRNRLDSAMELLRVARVPRSPAVLDIVLDGFGQLPAATQYDLMISVLHDVEDPRLTAALPRAISDAGPGYVSSLIEALVARDPAAAVVPILAALENPAIVLLKSTLEKMPPGSLAAAGPIVISALRTLAASSVEKNRFRIEQKTAALELLADRSVLADVQIFYDANKANLSREARAHLLAYMARSDAKNGAALLRTAVLADGLLIDQLSRSKGLPGFDQLCRERLFDSDIGVAAASAQALRDVGLSSDQALIEQRLTQWRDSFRSRAAADERADDGDTEAGLFSAATEGRQWRLAGADWDRVHAGCVTDRCRALKLRDREP